MNYSDRAKMEEITSHEIKKILYVATITASVPSEKMEPFAVEHLEYMAKVNETGQVFASGPFPAPGALFADGMTIFATKTIEEAKAIMDEEPFTKRKLRTYEMRTWRMQEGRLTVTLDATSTSFEFDTRLAVKRLIVRTTARYLATILLHYQRHTIGVKLNGFGSMFSSERSSSRTCSLLLRLVRCSLGVRRYSGEWS